MGLVRRTVGSPIPVVGLAAAMMATAVVVAVTMAAGAFACTNLATLNPSNPDGRVGDTITLAGYGFAVSRGTPAPDPIPVVVHWNGIDGPVLAAATPDRPGTFKVTFTVPEAAPGNYVIVATQSQVMDNGDGGKVAVNALGTPARVGFRVTAVGDPVLRADTSNPLAESDGTAQDLLLGVAVLMVALCLAAIVVGVIAVTCDPRRRPAPRPAPARRR